MSPTLGGGGGVAGSQPMSTAVYSHYNVHGAQINLGDLTLYLTDRIGHGQPTSLKHIIFHPEPGHGGIIVIRFL
jgi:hypothetical protein